MILSALREENYNLSKPRASGDDPRALTRVFIKEA